MRIHKKMNDTHTLSLCFGKTERRYTLEDREVGGRILQKLILEKITCEGAYWIQLPQGSVQ
jgi:hypothetical protein